MLSSTYIPDFEGALAFLEKAVPNLVDVTISCYRTQTVNMIINDDKWFAYLQGSCCNSLKSIVVEVEKFSDECVEATLKSMKKLEKLWLQAAHKFSKLQTMFSERVIGALAPTIKYLSISGRIGRAIPKQFLQKRLSKCKLLEKLVLWGASFDSSCPDALLDLPKLCEFKFSYAKHLPSINFLRPCKNLVKLHLSGDLSDISVFSKWREQQQQTALPSRRQRLAEIDQTCCCPRFDLYSLDISSCNLIADFSPLKDVSISHLFLPYQVTTDPEALLKIICEIQGLTTLAFHIPMISSWNEDLTQEMFLEYLGRHAKDLRKITIFCHYHCSVEFKIQRWLPDLNRFRKAAGLANILVLRR